jgi:Type VI secretion system, TssO
MEPLNSTERTKAFLKFTALFLLTVLLVCVAVLIDATIPSVQLKKLKEDNQRLTDLNAQSSLQYLLIDSINKDVSRYDIDSTRQTIIEQEVANCMVNLESLIKNDSSINVGITRDAMVSSKSWLDSKKKLKECANSSSIIASLKQQLSDAQKTIADDNKTMMIMSGRTPSQGNGK